METHKGFSIREYVCRMRSVNVAKCWPFDETTCEESVKSLLPPINIKKFIWWLDGLEYFHSETSKNVDNSSKKKKKKKRVQGKGESSLRSGDNVEESDADAGGTMGVVKVKPSTAKPKPRKEKSILEIFAVAPPVERISSKDEEEKSFQEEYGFSLNSKLARNEETNWGLKGRRTEKKGKKKMRKNKEIILSKLKEAEKAINKIRKRTRRGGDKTDLSIPNKVAVKMSHYGKQKAGKHVTFSLKDSILGRRKKLSLPEGYFESQQNSGSDMHDVHHPGSVETDSTIAEIGTFMNEEPFSGSVTSNRTCGGKNQHFFDTGPGEMLYDPPTYAFPQGIYRKHHEACYSSQNIKVIANSSSSTGAILIKDLGTPSGRFPPVCFKDYRKAYDRPLASIPSNLGKRSVNKMLQASSQGTNWNDAHPFGDETFPCLSSRGFLQTVYSPADGYRTENIHGKRGICVTNDDFVWLPLNSQGELITQNSNAKEDFDQMKRLDTTAAPPISLSPPSNFPSKCFGEHSVGRSWDCRTSSKDQLSLFPSQGFLKENPVVFDVNETNLDLDLIKYNDPSCNPENSLFKEENHVKKQTHGNEKILSTIRLMGKEFFKVDGRGFQECEDGHAWKDEQQITYELHFSNAPISNVMTPDQNQSLEKLRETLSCPSQFTINRRSCTYNFPPHFDCQTSSKHEVGFVTRKINPNEELYRGLSPGTFSAAYSSKSLFPKPFCNCYESQACDLEFLRPSAVRQCSPPNVSSSYIQLKNKQNLPLGPRSAMRFPFLLPHLEGHVQSSGTPTAHVEGSPQSSGSNFGCSHRPSLIPETKQGTDSSVSLNPEALFKYNPFSLGSIQQSPTGPASWPATLLTPQAPILPSHEVLPISSVKRRHGNQNVRQRIKSRFGIRGLGHGGKAKGQPSALSNSSLKPVEIPYLGFEDVPICDATKSTTCVHFEGVQNSEKALESYPATNKSK